MPSVSIVTNQCDMLIAGWMLNRMQTGHAAIFALKAIPTEGENLTYAGIEPYINRLVFAELPYQFTGSYLITANNGIKYSGFSTVQLRLRNTSGVSFTPLGIMMTDEIDSIVYSYLSDELLPPIPAGEYLDSIVEWWFYGTGEQAP